MTHIKPTNTEHEKTEETWTMNIDEKFRFWNTAKSCFKIWIQIKYLNNCKNFAESTQLMRKTNSLRS